MPVLDYAGLKIEVDEDGYLVHSSEWNEKAGCGLAVNEGIDEITVERMDVIKFMREYYAKIFSRYSDLFAVMCIRRGTV